MPRAPTAERPASRNSSLRLSVIAPVAPNIARVDALRCLVLAPVWITRRRRLKSRITPVRAELAIVIVARRTPWIPGGRNIAAVVIVVVVRSALLVLAV